MLSLTLVVVSARKVGVVLLRNSSIVLNVLSSSRCVVVSRSIRLSGSPRRAAILPMPLAQLQISTKVLFASCDCCCSWLNIEWTLAESSTVSGTFGIPETYGPKNANCSNPCISRTEGKSSSLPESVSRVPIPSSSLWTWKEGATPSSKRTRGWVVSLSFEGATLSSERT